MGARAQARTGAWPKQANRNKRDVYKRQQEDLTQYQKGHQFGERAAKTYLAFLIGGSMAVATQTWWVGLIASVGSRILMGQGRKKREQRDTLKDTIKTNEKVLKRLRLQAAT